MIQGLIEMYNVESGARDTTYALGDNYFDLTNYEASSGLGMEQILLGLTKQSAQGMDRHMTEEVTNKLFANVAPVNDIPGVGGDLVARNLQRGRDHGLPSYAAFYKEFAPNDNDAMDCWGRRPEQIEEANWDILRSLYK